MTEKAIYLAVRVPAQWRSIMTPQSWQSVNILSGRLGLFNNGMLGNESDYGTYKTGDETDMTSPPVWTDRKNWHFKMSCSVKLGFPASTIQFPMK